MRACWGARFWFPAVFFYFICRGLKFVLFEGWWLPACWCPLLIVFCWRLMAASVLVVFWILQLRLNDHRGRQATLHEWLGRCVCAGLRSAVQELLWQAEVVGAKGLQFEDFVEALFLDAWVATWHSSSSTWSITRVSRFWWLPKLNLLQFGQPIFIAFVTFQIFTEAQLWFGLWWWLGLMKFTIWI